MTVYDRILLFRHVFIRDRISKYTQTNFTIKCMQYEKCIKTGCTLKLKNACAACFPLLIYKKCKAARKDGK